MQVEYRKLENGVMIALFPETMNDDKCVCYLEKRGMVYQVYRRVHSLSTEASAGEARKIRGEIVKKVGVYVE